MKKKLVPFEGATVKVAENTTPENTARIMAELIRELIDDKDPFTYRIAALLNNGLSFNERSQLQMLGQFAYNNVYFEPDPIDRQYLRTPRRSIIDARGNCVDYTILIGAVAKAMGYSVTIRIVQFPGQKNFGHVYPVVNGFPIDVVPGQEQTGKEYLTRQKGKVVPVGLEMKYLSKFDTLV